MISPMTFNIKIVREHSLYIFILMKSLSFRIPLRQPVSLWILSIFRMDKINLYFLCFVFLYNTNQAKISILSSFFRGLLWKLPTIIWYCESISWFPIFISVNFAKNIAAVTWKEVINSTSLLLCLTKFVPVLPSNCGCTHPVRFYWPWYP